MKLESLVGTQIIPAINTIIFKPSDCTENINSLLKMVSIRLPKQMAYAEDACEAKSVICDWWQKPHGKLELAINGLDHISICLNRSDFASAGNSIRIMSLSAIGFYFRRGHVLGPGFLYKQLCDLSDQKKIDAKIHLYLHEHAKDVISDIPDHLSLVPTLKEFLDEYETLLTLPAQDPEKAKQKVNSIALHFKTLLNKRVDHISRADLLAWLDSHRLDLTQEEIESDFDRFDLADSTMKGALCTLRKALSVASRSSVAPFTLKKNLYCDELKLNVSNEVEDWYDLDKDLEILNKLLRRDRERLASPTSSCKFCDYFTPLVLLCRFTGLRPLYALSIRVSDIDFNLHKITIRGKKQGKITKQTSVRIDEATKAILDEWLKHKVHTNSDSVWLFPREDKPDEHMRYYKKTARKFKQTLSFKHFDFRAIRRTFATNLLLETNSIIKVKRALHHKNYEMTERYLNSVIDLSKVSVSCSTPIISARLLALLNGLRAAPDVTPEVANRSAPRSQLQLLLNEYKSIRKKPIGSESLRSSKIRKRYIDPDCDTAKKVYAYRYHIGLA